MQHEAEIDHHQDHPDDHGDDEQRDDDVGHTVPQARVFEGEPQREERRGEHDRVGQHEPHRQHARVAGGDLGGHQKAHDREEEGGERQRSGAGSGPAPPPDVGRDRCDEDRGGQDGPHEGRVREPAHAERAAASDGAPPLSLSPPR